MQQQPFARQRQAHPALVPVEQPGANLLFQRPDLDRQRRLPDVEARRGTGEVQLFGNGHEVAQMSQLHSYLFDINYSVRIYWTRSVATT